jgi:dolichol-phosphate mannosyltransferase
MEGVSCQATYSRAALITAAALMLLRLAFIGSTELFPEEAYYWNYAKHLDLSYLDHPPLVGWLIWLGTSIFGDGELGVRIFAPISSLITSGFAYLLTEFFYGRRAGVMAVLLVQVLPFFFMTGLMMTPDAPLTACWAGVLYFTARSIFGRGRRWSWWGCGLCLGLGMLSKYTIALLGPATLLFLFFDAPSRVWLRRAAPYQAVLFAVLIFSPVLFWNGRHHGASFSFQTLDRLAAPLHFSLHQLAAALLLFLTPVGTVAAWKVLRGKATPPETVERSVCDPERILLFTRLFTLTPLAVFVIFSVWHPVKLNWAGPLCLALVPTLAVQFTTTPSSLWQRGWVATVAIFGLAYLVLLQYLAWGIPCFGNLQKTELLPVGWSDLGRALSLQKDELRRASPTGKILIVGLDRNFIASEAAFYQPKRAEAVRETIGAHLFGARSLMYEAWFPVEEQEGATLLLISFKANDLSAAQIAGHTERLGPVREFKLKRKGTKIRSYFTRIAYNYRSALRVSP